MVSTKPNGLRPDVPIMIASKLEGTGGPDEVPSLVKRHVSSPGLLMRRESTRMTIAHRPLAENKRRVHSSIVSKNGTIRSATVPTRNLSQNINLTGIKTAPEAREPVHLSRDLGLTRTTTSILDINRNRRENNELRSRFSSVGRSEKRLFRKMLLLEKIENGDAPPRRASKDISLELYQKIKKENGVDNFSPKRYTTKGLGDIDLRPNEENNEVDNKLYQRKGETSIRQLADKQTNVHNADTPMHTRPIGARNSSTRNQPRQLPSLPFNDASRDVARDYDGPYNFDNPRYSIPVARGRAKNALPPSAFAGEQPFQQSPIESLPMTILDIANASPKIRQSKNGEWLFNTDEDVRNFRKLLRDPPPRTVCRNLDNLGHTNYCNKEKTKWIVDWIMEVDVAQTREGKWSDTNTEQTNGENKHR